MPRTCQSPQEGKQVFFPSPNHEAVPNKFLLFGGDVLVDVFPILEGWLLCLFPRPGSALAVENLTPGLMWAVGWFRVGYGSARGSGVRCGRRERGFWDCSSGAFRLSSGGQSILNSGFLRFPCDWDLFSSRPTILRMDEILHHLRNPGSDDSPINNNKYWASHGFQKWCEMDFASIHGICVF